MKTPFISLAAAIALFSANAAAQQPPNLIVIITDDLGYGDIGPYGATVVETPNIDRLAEEGLVFTDGYAPASTCTPTRYSFMTGEYAWRSPAGSSILQGNSGLTINENNPTIASVMQDAGYATAFIGKWHLGLGTQPTNYNGDIVPGYPELGFDYAFAMPATGDRTPTVFVENSRVTGLDPNDPIQVSYNDPNVSDTPLGSDPDVYANDLKVQPNTMQDHHAGSVVNGISRIGYMSGGHAARWVDEDFADTFAERALSFIDANQDKPFFMFYSTHDIHVPRMPHPRFQGTTGCGIRCDAIAEMDWQVGELLNKLDELDLAWNTLVVFSSDNGPVLNDGYLDGSDTDLNGHNPSGPLRGGKYSIWEGGTRVPFITRWPGVIEPGTSSAIVSLVDMLASGAALAGVDRAANAGPDSFNVLEALLGLTPESTRDHIVTQRNGTNSQAVRLGDWKFIPGNPPQLYDLSNDVHEDTNVADVNPEKLAELQALYQQIKNGSTRPEDDGFKFEPLQPPMGGNGGDAGSAGTASAAGAAQGGAGGSQVAVTGGDAALGGDSGDPTTPGAASSGDEAGCGCRTVGTGEPTSLFALLAVALFGFRRRQSAADFRR